MRSVKALQEIEGVHEDKPSVDSKDLYLVRDALKEKFDERQKSFEEKISRDESDSDNEENIGQEVGEKIVDAEETEDKTEKIEDKDREELEEEIEHVQILLNYIDESFSST